jgi:D-alanyl-D-alanine carboxypeptidase
MVCERDDRRLASVAATLRVASPRSSRVMKLRHDAFTHKQTNSESEKKEIIV